MMKIELTPKAKRQASKLGLNQKLDKATTLLCDNPNHRSLNFKKIQPKQLNIYSFRLDRQYRARCAFLNQDTLWVIQVGDFHDK